MKSVLAKFLYSFFSILSVSMIGIVAPSNVEAHSALINDHSNVAVLQNDCIYLAKKGGRAAPKPKKPQAKPNNGGKEAPKGSHHKNQREGNREKHENADARRQKEQKKAEEKRERTKRNK